MRLVNKIAALAAIAIIAIAATTKVEAGGLGLGWGNRTVTGGHPYHNGNLFIPPVSAYSQLRVRPPAWCGMPAYYYPQSYLMMPQQHAQAPKNSKANSGVATHTRHYHPGYYIPYNAYHYGAPIR